MLELGPAKEREMILAFLRVEADSSRFGNTVRAGFAAKHFTREQLSCPKWKRMVSQRWFDDLAVETCVGSTAER